MKDAILVEQTLAGDNQAFNGLIKEYYADIYAIILSWVRNPEDAKDLTQDTFISAYQKLSSLRQPQQFYLWLRQIAKRKCQNWQRNKQDNFATLYDDLLSKEPSTDEVLILRETLAKVMEAIDNLSESEKGLIKDHYIDDVSYDELSARHGVSAKALVVRLVRARRKIKDQLEKTLSAFVAFFHDHTESILTGGTEIVKVGIKTKLIAGITAVILISGGISISIWYHQRSQQVLLTQNIQAESSDFNSVPVFSKETTSINNIKIVTEGKDSKIGQAKEANTQPDLIQSKEDSITNQQESDLTNKAKNTESRKEIYNGMTKDEVEVALVEIDKEIYDKISNVALLYSELIEITQHYKPCPPDTTPEGMWNDCKSQFEYVSRNLVHKHMRYAVALGIDQNEPFRPGGWVYEILKQTPMMIGVR